MTGRNGVSLKLDDGHLMSGPLPEDDPYEINAVVTAANRYARKRTLTDDDRRELLAILGAM